MRVRLATIEDAAIQWAWANEARPWAISTARIPWDAHLRWMERIISDEDRVLYIGEQEGPVGSVRFDRREDEQWEVSIIVDSARRGNGYGRRLLDAGIAAHGATTYLARVSPANQRSLGLFRHWTEISPTDDPVPLRRFVYDAPGAAAPKDQVTERDPGLL